MVTIRSARNTVQGSRAASPSGEVFATLLSIADRSKLLKIQRKLECFLSSRNGWSMKCRKRDRRNTRKPIHFRNDIYTLSPFSQSTGLQP